MEMYKGLEKKYDVVLNNGKVMYNAYKVYLRSKACAIIEIRHDMIDTLSKEIIVKDNYKKIGLKNPDDVFIFLLVWCNTDSLNKAVSIKDVKYHISSKPLFFGLYSSSFKNVKFLKKKMFDVKRSNQLGTCKLSPEETDIVLTRINNFIFEDYQEK